MALSDQTTVLYLCSTPYAPGREHGITPLDPALGIPWPAEAGLLLSDKDSAAHATRMRSAAANTSPEAAGRRCRRDVHQGLTVCGISGTSAASFGGKCR